jgi:hypothetical protein
VTHPARRYRRHQYTEIDPYGRTIVHDTTYDVTAATTTPRCGRPCRNLLWATCCFEFCCRDNVDFDCCTICCPLTVGECCCPT